MATSIINGVELYYDITGSGPCLVLTHGSWTDGAGWGPAVDLLAARYRVVTWDRRGHSRSQAGAGPGSRAEDAADLAALIETVSAEPVHVAGNSYGATVTLTMLTERPELVATTAVHEPPLFGLLDGTGDPALASGLDALGTDLAVVRELITSGRHRDAAAYFVDHVALGPGSWDGLPEALRSVLEVNAPTFLDELRDDTALSIDTTALASTTVPLLITGGTESPGVFAAVAAELAQLVPAARVEVLEGAGHMPHATISRDWVARLVAFHDRHPSSRQRQPS